MARIMIADDNPSVRLLISALVTDAGHEVVLQAKNGQEALSAYFNAKPDLLIVDYRMPVMDGISLIEQITKVDPEVKVLLCTASTDALGNDSRLIKDIAVISKPFDNNEFLGLVAVALEN
ncbi:response regulator [Cohnella caldifontis]|uniref:response regulator n=1 Tax=Cohnella caldifontis TaxID=3027471 RepID=UPI0023EDEDC1|nr:response regulator [Cohnella sp. YIM B05605]